MRAITTKKPLEERLTDLERKWEHYESQIIELSKLYSLQKKKVNPNLYCKDDFDRSIINYLIDNLGAGTTEIAKGLGLEEPEVARHSIGKRLKVIAEKAKANEWIILTFDTENKEHPITKEKKSRAWWINVENVDVEEFKKNMDKIKSISTVVN